MPGLDLIPTPTPAPPADPRSLAGLTPETVVERWPPDHPLAALVSDGRDAADAGRSRWSILSAPTRSIHLTADDLDAADPLAILRAALRDHATPAPPDAPHTPPAPFRSGWIGVLAYELGGILEPRGRRGIRADHDRALIDLHRFDGGFVHDRLDGSWRAVGDTSGLPSFPRDDAGGAISVGPARSDLGRHAYEAAVRRAIEYIRAGDVFQVNVAHTLEAPFSGDPRAMFARLVREAGPWYGAYAESRTPDRLDAVCSISPELFLSFDARTREVVTRPIKGTSPADAPEATLRESEKDAAELVMIVDLMRNDLGRVCTPGSIRVVEPRTLERHGPVRHGVATVRGTLRPELDAIDLVGAAFPAGSITGAPKVRAMQIINELEPSPRGPYCGAIGWFADDGSMTLNVGIRTATVSGTPDGAGGIRGTVRYGAGAGIVADSDPASEWNETLHKARGFLGAVQSFVEEPSA